MTGLPLIRVKGGLTLGGMFRLWWVAMGGLIVDNETGEVMGAAYRKWNPLGIGS